MSELDRVKEELVYLRFWLGIMVVTEITLAGWLAYLNAQQRKSNTLVYWGIRRGRARRGHLSCASAGGAPD
jgi:hypothetical protein